MPVALGSYEGLKTSFVANVTSYLMNTTKLVLCLSYLSTFRLLFKLMSYCLKIAFSRNMHKMRYFYGKIAKIVRRWGFRF